MKKPAKKKDPPLPVAHQVVIANIGDLKPYDRNPRDHSAEQVEAIARSILEHGFNDPIGVRRNTIIEGHGRLLAAQRIGLTKVPVLKLDHLTEAQALAYLIAHNKLALNATWNYDWLAEKLAELPSLGIDPTVTGFDEKEIDAIANGWKPDFEQPHPGNGDGPLRARIVVTCDPKDKPRVMALMREAVAGIDGVEIA